MKKKALTTIIFGLLVQTTFSQTFDRAKLDNYFEQLEKSRKFMGSVALFEKGQVVYTKAVGYADIDSKLKPTENTKYRVGSISKSFTSVLVMKAVEEEKITLDTKLKVYFPTIKNAEKITISNLLNHRSGIHSFTDDSTYIKWSTQKKSEAEMVKIIESGGSDFEPDSKADYSNSNFVLLSYILQKEYKKTYSELLTEKITKPIGLKNTFVGSKINLKNNECNSYEYFTNWEKQAETDMSVPMGAGAVVSTPSDLAKFAFALFNGKIISTKSVELMKSLKDKYGYGLFQVPFDDKISFGHTGSIDGFSSVYGYFPKENIGFAMTSNGSNYNNNKISIALLCAIFNATYEIPNFQGFQYKTEDLDKYLGTYSCKEFPVKITISKNDKILVCQATGERAFELDAAEKDKFKSDKVGIKLEFIPTEKTMIMEQYGEQFKMIKE